ncbi:MAG TPA: hypothetical protein VK626_10440, partial [Nitrospiraceae bacterium]|nr:hypothetical protein [Nitrospiraceae bacterium]
MWTWILHAERLENIRKSGETAQLSFHTWFVKFVLTIPFKAVTPVQIPLETPILPFISSYPTRCFSLFIPLSLPCELDTLVSGGGPILEERYGDGEGNAWSTDDVVDWDQPRDRGSLSWGGRATALE